MSGLAQVDRIISEVNTLGEKEKIILFERMKEMLNNSDKESEKSADEITIESAFGLWKDRNITKEILRKKAWKQN
jgi:hypothetical protein